jgi:lysophospholipase L1-like esterase
VLLRRRWYFQECDSHFFQINPATAEGRYALAVSMSTRALLVVGSAVLAVACGGPLASPTSAGRTARLSRTRFMAFGDSLTAGEVTAPIVSQSIHKQVVVPAASYPTQLQLQLASRYASQASAIRVVNAGVAGENLFRAVLRFEDALAEHVPEAAMIMHGLNNLGGDGPDVPTILMRDMVRMAKARGMHVFVGSMLPTIAGRTRSQNVALLETYNAKLRQMSAEEGVVFVDLYTPLLPEVLSVIGVDGLHPTEAGYRRIADVFFNAIASNLEE